MLAGLHVYNSKFSWEDAIAKKVLIKVQRSKVQEDKMFQKTLAENFQRIS